MLSGMQSHTHDLTFTGGEVQKRFLTWSEGEADREWACLQAIEAHAPGIAPRPLRRETVGGHPVVVMSRLPGDALGGAPLTPAQTASLGQTLRRLHGMPLDRVMASGIGERRLGPSTLRPALRGWLRAPEDLSACHDPALVRAGIDAAVAWLSSSDALPAPEIVSLGIADLNPANILWDGRTCRLVDFEDGGLTDPAYDLADHVEHIAGRLTGVFDAGTLLAAVGISDEGKDRFHAYRPLWAAFWLAMLLPGNGGFSRNPSGSTEAQARHLLGLLGQ